MTHIGRFFLGGELGARRMAGGSGFSGQGFNNFPDDRGVLVDPSLAMPGYSII